MANDPNDFRKPTVHDDGSSSGGIGKWLAIAAAVLLALLLLLWLFGAFEGDAVVPGTATTETTTDAPDAVVVDPDAVVVTE